MNAPFFAFVNAKGGSGSSTICAELVKLMRGNRKIAAVDGDLSGRRNLAILLDGVRALDAKREGNKCVGVADLNGFSLVELAPSFDSVFTISKEEVESLAASCVQDADCVILDIPIPFAAPVRAFVVRATRFIVVAEPTLLGVASAGTMIAEMKNFGIPITRLLLITNARGGNVEIARGEIERVLGVKVAAELPPMNDRNFFKTLAAFEKTLAQIAAEPELESVFPSAQGLAQDRRWSGSRRPSEMTMEEEPRPSAPQRGVAAPQFNDTHEKLKLLIHETLAKNINLIEASAASSDTAKLAELRAKIDEVSQQVLSEKSASGDRTSAELTAEDLAQIKEEIVNESLGLGPLEGLLTDAAITEIMVNGAKTVYVERAGKVTVTGKRFTSPQQLRLVIERIIAPLGRRLDESVPMVDARLPDGSRVNAIIEPLAIDGATLTIRRFGKKRMQAQDLLEKGSATEEMLDFMRACIEARLNIVISGGTGSGKTTFLNILSSYIPSEERIITVEDAAELFLAQPHVVRLETRPPNLEGAGAITIRDLVRNSLRMRPDRIVVGECRGGEALDMLQAMNTGHDGSLTTAHANTPRDALSRLETMVLMAGFDLPVRAIREQIASAVDMIIQIARLRDGSRKVVSISEVIGMEGEVVTMQEVVKYAQHGMDAENKVAGEFQFTGVQPNALQRFDEYGVHVRRPQTHRDGLGVQFMVTSSTTIFHRLNAGGGAENRLRDFADELDRAGITQSLQQVFAGTAFAAALIWLLLVLVMHPALLLAVVLLPASGGAALLGLRMLVKMKVRKRLEQFSTQLEVALRLISSGVRIGLGLRQALAMVIDEMPDPARHEFLRVIGHTNIGISVYDALDSLAKRMPSNETVMMSRAIRIQSQTGGDLGKILEHLANTIKERRRIQRKIRALTAEGRASAGILSALPPFLGVFIFLTEPSMGQSLVFTAPGHVALLLVVVLETLGVITLMKMLKVDV